MALLLLEGFLVPRRRFLWCFEAAPILFLCFLVPPPGGPGILEYSSDGLTGSKVVLVPFCFVTLLEKSFLPLYAPEIYIFKLVGSLLGGEPKGLKYIGNFVSTPAF